MCVNDAAECYMLKLMQTMLKNCYAMNLYYVKYKHFNSYFMCVIIKTLHF